MRMLQHLHTWAVRLGPAQVCSLEAQPVPVFPLLLPFRWLSSADWLLWGKWKVRTLPPRFLYGLRCMCPRLILKFWFCHHLGSFSMARPGTLEEQEAPPWFTLREGYAGVRACWWGKVWFLVFIFQIGVSVMFWYLSRRLPSACLWRGLLITKSEIKI